MVSLWLFEGKELVSVGFSWLYEVLLQEREMRAAWQWSPMLSTTAVEAQADELLKPS